MFTENKSSKNIFNNSYIHTYLRREIAAESYAVSPYWISQCITNLPFMAFFLLVFVVVFYFPCDFPLNFEYFYYMYVLLFLNMILSFYIAMILAASTNGNKELSLALFPLIFILLSRFGYLTHTNIIHRFYPRAVSLTLTLTLIFLDLVLRGFLYQYKMFQYSGIGPLISAI